MTPQIRFFGDHELTGRDQTPVTSPPRKAWGLLAYLSLTEGREVQREIVSALLWPKSHGGQGRASLRQELSVLKRILAEAGLDVLEARKDTVRLILPAETTDVALFEAGISSKDKDRVRASFSLYRADFLASLKIRSSRFEEWVWLERQRLRELFVQGGLWLLDAELAAQNMDALAEVAEAILRVDPYQEAATRALMQVSWHKGAHIEALRRFGQLEINLQRELGTGPSEQTCALAAQIRAESAGGVTPERGPVVVNHISLAVPAPLGGVVPVEQLLQAQAQLEKTVQEIAESKGGIIASSAGDRILVVHKVEAGLNATAAHAALAVANAIVKEPISVADGVALWPRCGLAMGEAMQFSSFGISHVVSVAVQRAAETGLRVEPGMVAHDESLNLFISAASVKPFVEEHVAASIAS